MVATLLLEDLNKANDNELADHLNGLLAAPGGGFDPSNILPRQIPVGSEESGVGSEGATAATPPQELQDHVQSLFAAAPSSTSAPAPAPTPSPEHPTPQPNVVQQLADHVAQTTGLKWIGEGITNLQGGVQQATSGLTNLVAPQPQVSPAPTSAGGPSVPTPGGPLVDYARQVAQRFGVDPDIFVRQIQQESGFRPDARSPAGATGIAQFMPDTARGMGVDPTDPYQSLEGGARLMRQNLDRYGGDYAKALAAYNAGPGNVDKYGGVPPFEETQRYISTILGGTSGRAVATPTEGLGRAGAAIGAAQRDISQFGDSQLTNSQAYAACGPAAAVRFAQRFGRNPTLSEAVQLARTVGWTEEQGMAGLASEKALMDKMGVPTKMVSGADWGTFANEARTGNPVTISTRGHYFTADGWDPATNRFHVGRSGLDLKGGSEWMTPEQMTGLMGEVQGGLLADNPQAPGSTVQVAGVQSGPQASPEGRQGIQFLGEDSQTAAGFTAPGGPPRGFLEQAAETVGSGFSRLGEAAQGGLQILDDAVNATGSNNPTPAATPGVGYDPSAFRAETTPLQEGVPLRQDVRDLGQTPQPTLLEPGGPVGELLGQIGEAPGLSEADRAARRQAIEESPVGQVYGSDIRKQLLPNITEPNHPINVMADLQEKYGTIVPNEQMTPEDQQRAREAQLFIGGMTGVAGPAGKAADAAAEAVGQRAGGIDYDALAQLRRRTTQTELPGTPAAEGPNLADRALAFTVNNVLSNPASLLANAAGGLMETVKRPVVTAATAGVEALTGRPGRAATQLGAAGADVRAMGLAVGDALADAATTFGTGRRLSRAADQPEAFEGAAGVVATPFLRVMGATDEFISGLNSSGAQGAKLVELMRAHPELSQAEVMSQFQKEILEAGQRGAAEAIYQIGGSGVGESLARWRRQLTVPDATLGERIKGAAAQIVVPFSSVPDVIITRGAKRVPGINELLTVGQAAAAAGRGDIAGAKRQAAAGMLATMTNLAIYAQVQEGNITGSGPDDPAKKRALMNARDENGNPLWRPNSIRVGDQWVPYSSLGGVAIQIGSIANAVEQYEYAGRQVDPDMAGAWGAALGDTITDAWYLQTLAGAFRSIQTGKLPEWAGSQALSTAGRAIPESALLNTVKKLTDPTAREAEPKLADPRTWLEYFQAKTPLSAGLEVGPLDIPEVKPKLDPATGRPIEEPQTLASVLTRGTAPGVPNPVNEALARHNLGVGDAPKTITPAEGLTIAINDDEQRRFLELSGPEVEKRVLAMTNNASYQRAAPDQQRELLQDVISDGREVAAIKLFQALPRAEQLRRLREYEAAQKRQAEPAVRLP